LILAAVCLQKEEMIQKDLKAMSTPIQVSYLCIPSCPGSIIIAARYANQRLLLSPAFFFSVNITGVFSTISLWHKPHWLQCFQGAKVRNWTPIQIIIVLQVCWKKVVKFPVTIKLLMRCHEAKSSVCLSSVWRKCSVSLSSSLAEFCDRKCLCVLS
jgi:hypothetical protein